MYRKLFQVTLVVCLVAVTVAALAVIGGVIRSLLSPTMIGTEGIGAGTRGFSFHAISISSKQLGFMIVAASLIIAGFYLYRRRSRFRR